MYFLQREQRRVMQAEQTMMDILSKVMPYKVRAISPRPSLLISAIDKPACPGVRVTT